MFTFAGQQIPHGVTQSNDKSASACQRTVNVRELSAAGIFITERCYDTQQPPQTTTMVSLFIHTSRF